MNFSLPFPLIEEPLCITVFILGKSLIGLFTFPECLVQRPAADFQHLLCCPRIAEHVKSVECSFHFSQTRRDSCFSEFSEIFHPFIMKTVILLHLHICRRKLPEISCFQRGRITSLAHIQGRPASESRYPSFRTPCSG